MSRRTNIVLVVVVIAVLAVTWAMLGPAIAQTKPAAQKPPQDKLALAELEVKQLLLLTQERQDFQTRVDDVYGSGVQPAGYGPEGNWTLRN